ncbi:hypothetical protein J6590_011847 [Homalodisca vitripennis]|nr:hypothetical protein J6590_011847 [Homalodisca vitripennis]
MEEAGRSRENGKTPVKRRRLEVEREEWRVDIRYSRFELGGSVSSTSKLLTSYKLR